MKLTVSIKFLCSCCTPPQWHDIPLDDVVRWGWEQSLEHFSHYGDVVIKVIGNNTTYICGNQRWIDYYTPKGRTLTMEQGLPMLQQTCPEFTPEFKELLRGVSNVFGEQMVSDVTFL